MKKMRAMMRTEKKKKVTVMVALVAVKKNMNIIMYMIITRNRQFKYQESRF